MTDGDLETMCVEMVQAKLATAWRQRDIATRGRSQRYTFDEAELRSKVEEWAKWLVPEIVLEVQRVMTRSDGEYRSSSYEPGLKTTLAPGDDGLTYRSEDVPAPGRSEGTQ